LGESKLTETLLAAFCFAFVISLLLVISSQHHGHISGDHDRSQPQKFHVRSVPRIGGVGIMLGLIAAAIAASLQGQQAANILWGLIAAGSVAFTVGLIEDFTKRVTPKQRLIATAASAALAAWLVNGIITTTDIPGLDTLMLITGVPVACTVFAVAGVANSLNIIDGFNGLASMCTVLILGAIGFVAYQEGDAALAMAAWASASAVLGFFVLNFPRGLIFLGDGGAYVLGFWIAELAILLITRNKEVSPLFALLLCAYPIFETVFTMYRRRIVRQRPVGLPDAVHLHSLIYRRLMRWAIGSTDPKSQLLRNSMTSPYLWILCSLSIAPAIAFRHDAGLLTVSLIVFCALYMGIYRAIVQFRTPPVLVRNARIERRKVPRRMSAANADIAASPLHNTEVTPLQS